MDRMMILWEDPGKGKKNGSSTISGKGGEREGYMEQRIQGYVWIVKGQRVRAVKGGDDGEVDKW